MGTPNRTIKVARSVTGIYEGDDILVLPHKEYPIVLHNKETGIITIESEDGNHWLALSEDDPSFIFS